MMFQIIGGATNIIADIIFIVFFKMGVEGAAIGTFLSQTLTSILSIIHICRHTSKVNFNISFKNFDNKLFNRILTIGVPAGIQSIVITLSNIIIQSDIKMDLE